MEGYLWLLSWSLVVSQVLHTAHAYEDGGPFSSCANLLVDHDHMTPTLTPSPYVIELNQTSYTPGESIQVTLRSPVGRTFQGYMMVTRRAQSGDREENVGTFSDWSTGVRPISYIATPHNHTNCLTHSKSNNKTRIFATWTAPDGSVGHVIFRASVVQDYETFWYDLRSEVLTANDVSVDEPYMAEISSDFQPMNLSACGVTKGCLLYPDWCDTVESCNYAVTYQPTEDQSRVEFEIMGRTEAYVSLALSSDKSMGHEVTLSCIEKDGRMAVENGFNPHLTNAPQLRVNIRAIQLTRINDKVLCRFTKLIEEDYYTSEDLFNPTNISYRLSDRHYMFVAWGDVYRNTLVMKKHTVLPLVSIGRINISEALIVQGRTLHTALRVHAALGIVTWMWLSALAITIARHYRTLFSAQIGGSTLWLQIHKYLTYMVIGLTIPCFIIIFAYVRTWTVYARAHSMVGTCAFCTMFLCLALGLCRPVRASRKQQVIDWVHRIGGVSAHFLSVAACIVGFRSELVITELYWLESEILFVWLAFHFAADIFMERFPAKYVKTMVPVKCLPVQEVRRSSNPRVQVHPSPEQKAASLPTEVDQENTQEVCLSDRLNPDLTQGNCVSPLDPIQGSSSPGPSIIALIAYILISTMFCCLSLHYLLAA